MKHVYETHGHKEDKDNNIKKYVELSDNEEKEEDEECHKKK